MTNYTMRDFEERKTNVFTSDRDRGWGATFEGHRIAFMECDRSSYFYVIVDGKTIATRTREYEGLRKALAYINKLEA